MWPRYLATMSFFNQLLTLIYPSWCVGCGRFGTLLCSKCLDCIEPVVTLKGIDHSITTSLTEYKPAYLFNKPIKDAILSFKYEGIIDLAPILGKLLYDSLPDWPVNMCTCVPLHPEKLKIRGFNQAELLAKCLAQHAQLPYQSLLLRTYQTTTQAHLTKSERLTNYQANAFVCSSDLRGQNILLIDDVLTTGATLGACAQALKQAGAQTVYGFTLAHGQ